MADHIQREGYVHRSKAGADGAPALFVFHGTGGDENQFFEFGTGLLPDATIVSPRGDVSEHGAARFFRRTGEGVYDMDDLARATAKMASFVDANARAHKAGEIIGLGYSNGANILANVMFQHPHLFSRAILLHPLIPFSPPPQPGLSGKRVLITAGERDQICPAPATRALIAYFRDQGAEMLDEWHDGGHDIRRNELVAVERFLT